MNNNRGNNRRRGRGNNGRPQNGGQQLNRIDSRARGNAPQMLEKYRKLAQDAHLNGDRVQAEYYLQFADHYFRVIADTRVRQEEQRARQNGGERWQEQDAEEGADEFSVEGDFPAFDRPVSTRREREDREDRQDRGERQDRGDRYEGRRDREDRQRDDRPREDRQRDDRQRDDRPREDRQREDRQRDDRGSEERGTRREGTRRFERNRSRDAEAEAAPAEALPGEGVPAIEGEPIADANDNPFVTRATRGLRPRTERRPRGAKAAADEAPAMLDASFLPPSISAKVEAEPAPAAAPAAEVVVEEVAAPAPKKRGRPRKTPVAEATEPAEG